VPDAPRPWLRGPGYRRLLAVRFATQAGDGMFQAALGAAVLFNPERQADPLAVAAGLAVLLLPYSLVGPFAGALLDRWDRRRVLLLANLVRSGLVLLVAAAVAGGAAGPPLFAAALAVTGVSRFVQAGLSAALPHVVARADLVPANALAVTAGAGSSALGGVLALGLNALVGAGDRGSGLTTAVAAAAPLLAGLVAAGFPRGSLGPGPAEDRTTARAVARGLLDGARAVVGTPSVASAFLALAAHRLAFGVSTLLTLLLFRAAGDGGGVAGLAGVGAAVALAAAGLGCAALVAPPLVRRLGRPRTVRLALVVAGAAQLALAALLGVPALLAAAFVVGLAGQVVKLCTDAAVQADAGDGVLGRVFALYDIVFNAGYVLAITATALLSPPDGRAPALLVAAAALYGAGLLAHDAVLRHRPVAGRPPSCNEPA
jgi:MFS family permease